ncbi:methyltransferase domain-containing protein [Leptospira sarikeiensis]|uniref:Arsenite methyltransferase n=1 Tax=Leptospira sarikeiensis TaxID=2484943 RepID=A0A4R9KAS6_9LEPT|nr:methyltransferase domain-containing protein [Leptospira sarikeiensis]TGL63807.1 methyltransferase domain-containing protein [Leptospira sarikeiensis]
MAQILDKTTLDSVQQYYGKVLQSSSDLKTGACCSTESLPKNVQEILPLIHQEVKDKFYGCGSPFPPQLKGARVLDLGSGSGRDSFLLSNLVGQNGKVIGVDMTEEQISLANRYVDYHTEKFGYSKPNIEFRHGYIEDLKTLGIEDESVDLVVSNCVINLSPDKKSVFKEIFRVLKPGGELYFSDVFASRRVPTNLKNDPVLLGECLGGALYTEDFRRLIFDLGIRDFRVISSSKISLQNEDIERKVGMIDFYSVTYRIFKLKELEDKCEDYGQVAFYLGTIPEHPHAFLLDDHHILRKGLPMLVCGNTAAMLSKARYKDHFKIVGDTSVHYGLFDCGPSPASLAITTQGIPSAPDALSGGSIGGACC